jgi:hypothetical protein
MNRLNRILLLAGVVATALLALALGTAESQAVITAPITNGAASLPPLATFPEASDTAPPAHVISDPIEPAASCGDWYRQSAHVGRPTSSTWWEYACTLVEVPPCAPMCNAIPMSRIWTDYFYWDGSQAVFYGEHHFVPDPSMWFGDCEFWWDEPTSEWSTLYDCYWLLPIATRAS